MLNITGVVEGLAVALSAVLTTGELYALTLTSSNTTQINVFVDASNSTYPVHIGDVGVITPGYFVAGQTVFFTFNGSSCSIVQSPVLQSQTFNVQMFTDGSISPTFGNLTVASQITTGDQVIEGSLLVEGPVSVPPGTSGNQAVNYSQLEAVVLGANQNPVVQGTAGVTVSANTAVAIVNGKIVPAQSGELVQVGNVLGVSQNGGAAGTVITVQQTGSMGLSSWNWTLGQPIFVGPNGPLTQTPPSSGFVQVVAIPLTPTSISIGLHAPIILQ